MTRAAHAPIGLLLAAAALACDGPSGTIYLTSGIGDSVLVLDAADGSRRAALSVDRRRGETDEPHGVAVSPDGRHLYVTLAHGEPSLWKFERPGDRRVGRLDLGGAGAARIAVSADGRTGFIADYERGSGGRPGEVVSVDLGTLEVRARSRPCAGPHDARPAPDGAVVAVACSLSDEVVFLDGATLEVTARYAAGPDPGPAGSPRYRPLNLAWLDARTAALTLAGSGELVRVGREDGVRHRVGVGASPAQVAFEPASGRLVVANRGDGTASLVDAGSWTEAARVPLDVAHPHGVALDPARGRAFVSFEGTTGERGGVVALDVRTGHILWSVTAGTYTLGVAFGS
ncbi:MAG TPA: YncE family protein [Longimicrobiales bacterium]|nr:YncE family protein [Longimicrobiales bacterium]